MSGLLFNRDFQIFIGENASDEAVLVKARPPLQNTVTSKGSAQPTMRMSFKIQKNLAHDPNKADIKIYNLSAETRAKIQPKNTPIILEAGYVGNLSQVFAGVVTFVNHERQGPDWVSSFTSGDGLAQYQTVRVNKAFKGPIDVGTVAKTAFEAMSGIGIGNALTKIQENPRGIQFGKGIVLNGRAADVISGLMKSLGLEWSIQDGSHQVLDEGAPSADTVFQLDATSGLIGSPSFGESKTDKQPIVKVKCLLNGNIKAGRLLFISTKEVHGFFRAESVVHSGDTWSQEWYSEIEAVEKK